MTIVKSTIKAIGRVRGELLVLMQDYCKRLRYDVTTHEFEARKGTPAQMQQEEAQWLTRDLPQSAFVIALDERGKQLTSPSFAHMLEKTQSQGKSHVVFLIGGADGLTQEVRERADFLLSFGEMVWPHKLARLMLMEQLYRAQSILAGHPYHRD